MAEVEIRAAWPSDAHQIAEVHVAGWRWGYRDVLSADFLANLSVERRAAMWSGCIEDPASDEDVFVADRGGRIVGFASVATSQDEDAAEATGELKTIYVLEEVAGTGVGARLLRRAQDRLRQRGFARATLWVLDSNQRARAFYERHGWRADGTVKVEEPGVTLREVRYALDLAAGPLEGPQSPS